MPKRLIAFHGKRAIKDKYLNRVRKHRDRDQLLQCYGYWNHGKGCGVGCTIHGSDHARYETELGIPEALAWIEDVLFERMSAAAARQWPVQFLSAIRVGADLSEVAQNLGYWMMQSVYRHQHPAVRPVAKAALSFCSGQYDELAGSSLWVRLSPASFTGWSVQQAARALLVRAVLHRRFAGAPRRYCAQAPSESVGAERAAKKLLELLRAAPVRKPRRKLVAV